MSSKLNYDVFQENFLDWLCAEHFKVPVSSTKSIKQYLKEFSIYSDNQFEELCNLAFKEKFLPCVNWFHEQGKLLIDRDHREQNIFSPPPNISEEQRLLNVSRVRSLTASFLKDQLW